MKVNEFLKRNRGLVLVYFCSVIVSMFLLWQVGPDTSSIDTESYITAISSFENGHLDVFRCPVYPLLIWLFRSIFGVKYHLLMLVICQHLLFLISIYFFYKIAVFLKIKPRITILICLFYGCLPLFNVWNNRILTESIAISLSVILIYLLIKQIYSYRCVLYSAILGILLVVMILLRPIFIYFLPVFFVFYMAFLVKNTSRSATKYGLISVFLASLLIIGYMSEFKREFGIFSLGTVNLNNSYYSAEQAGLIQPFDFESLSPIEKKEYIDKIYKESQSNIVEAIIKRGLSSFDSLIFYRPALYHIRITMGIVYLVLLIYIVLLMFSSVSQKRIYWISTLMFLLATSNILVAVIGAQAEWNRLFFPSLPYVFFMLGQLLSPIDKSSVLKIKF